MGFRLWPFGRAAQDRRLADLQASEARYRLVADHVRDVVFQTDINAIIQYVSPSIEQFGYRAQDLIGRDARELRHPEEFDRREQVISSVLGGRRPDAAEQFRLSRGDGGWVWVEGNPALIHDADGEPIGIVSMLRDVTRRRALEDELRLRRAEAEAAAAAKSEFMANMSHEIRTPLTAVIGFATLLQKIEGLPPKAQVYADRIVRGGDSLNAIVNHILDFSRVEAGQVELKQEAFAVAAMVDEVLALARDEAEHKRLTLEQELHPDLPAEVFADRGRLAQVLLNLINNAVKFTHAGSVRVRVGYDTGRLRIAVADTGIGVPADVQGRLFQRFSQVDGSNARRFGGAGLGLAICKGLVELMDGEIGMESVEGQGSTFWFTAPAPAIDPVVLRAPPPPAVEAPLLRPGRILIVDDVTANRELVAEMVAAHGIEVVQATEGESALALSRRQAFDVILMDLQMPGMDGMATSAAIRAAAALNRETPIVAVSASVLPADVAACRDAGMADHIAKPIKAEELQIKLSRWLAA